MQIFSFAGFIWLLISNYTKKYFQCFKSWLLRAQPCWFTFYRRIEEKVWLVMYMVFSPHISAFFMSSLIQTAEHKMAAFTVMFSQLFFSSSSNTSFKGTEPEVKRKSVVCLCFVLFLSWLTGCKTSYLLTLFLSVGLLPSTLLQTPDCLKYHSSTLSQRSYPAPSTWN